MESKFFLHLNSKPTVMKPQTIKINIENPCHENWDKMLQEEKGKFCQACEKSVVDFSRMGNAEIIDFLNKANGKVCGRISKYQLNTPISNYVPVKSTFFNKYIAGVLMALGLYSPAHSQTKPTTPKEIEVTMGTVAVRKPMGLGALTINGKLIDSKTKKPIVFANISIQGSHISVNSDKNGKYTIKVPAEYRNADLTLVISHSGHDDLYLNNFDTKKDVISITSKMKSETEYIKGDMMIMGKIAIDPNEKNCDKK